MSDALSIEIFGGLRTGYGSRPYVPQVRFGVHASAQLI